MSSFLDYRDNSQVVVRDVERLAHRLQNLSPALRELGEHMVNESVPRTFREGGRPQKWKGTRRGGEIQRDSGVLLASISEEVSPGRLRVGTNLAYAAQRHYGGPLKPTKSKFLAVPIDPNNKRRPKHYGKRLRWAPGRPGATHGGILVETMGGRGKGRRSIVRFVLVKEVTQPPRPFLVMHPEDIVFAEKALVRHVAGQL